MTQRADLSAKALEVINRNNAFHDLAPGHYALALVRHWLVQENRGMFKDDQTHAALRGWSIHDERAWGKS